MTAQQLKRIAELRAQNYPYSFIGRELGLPSNTVKSICRRKGFHTSGSRKTKKEKQNPPLCRYCRNVLTGEGRLGRQFCSEKCRVAWWRSQREVIEK